MFRFAFLVSHPTQFEVPFYQAHEQMVQSGLTKICLDIYYLKHSTVNTLFDKEIGRPPGWDFNDGIGYRYYKVPDDRFARVNFLLKNIYSGAYDAVIINGYRQNEFLLNLFLAIIKKVPLVLRADSVRLYQYKTFKERLKQIFLPMTYRLIDAFLSVGTLSRQALIHLGVPEEHIFLFPYAVDNNQFYQKSDSSRKQRSKIRREMGIPENAVVFIAVNKFVPREGPLDLLEAFHRLNPVDPRAMLLLVGDGPQRGEITEYLQQNDMGNVLWVGYQPYSQLPRLFGISDVFIHPAHEECWGVSVNEAMACGLPIILSHLVGSGVDLLDGNGLSYQAGNIEELTNCIITMTEEEERRLCMGKRSLEIIKGWDFRQTSDQLEALADFLHQSKSRLAQKSF